MVKVTSFLNILKDLDFLLALFIYLFIYSLFIVDLQLWNNRLQ